LAATLADVTASGAPPRDHARPFGLVTLLIACVRLYQLTLSRALRWFGPVCRFHPSCSEYTLQCLKLHGAARGLYLGGRRILRCQPFHPGGYDPPPAPREQARQPSEHAAGK
jgi:uncharacterized protein